MSVVIFKEGGNKPNVKKSLEQKANSVFYTILLRKLYD